MMKTPEQIAHDVWQEIWQGDVDNEPDEVAERKIAAAIREALKDCKAE